MLVSVTVLLAAQVLLNGSDGSMGPLNPSTDQLLVVPPDGRFNYTFISIPTNVTVRFTRNGRNDPVFLLSQGDVLIAGTIFAEGITGTLAGPGNGGAGGFDGGEASQGVGLGGSGHGPGGGRDVGAVPNVGADRTSAGAYATVPLNATSTAYGIASCFPLVGGSGGAGSRALNGGSGLGGGGGGGGAVLIASEGRITVTGKVTVRGGHAGPVNTIDGPGAGSGGAIRLVGNEVEVTGTLDARGGGHTNALSNVVGGMGRIRIDAIKKSQAVSSLTTPPASLGTNLAVALDEMPRLELIAVAGISTNGQPFTKMLPSGSGSSHLVEMQAAGFPDCVDVSVRMVPELGTVTTTVLTGRPNGVINTDIDIPANIKATVEISGKPAGCQ
ncbi:MAG: hypothetical protein Q8O67_31525 [Deltaproteobacteria bacterium]|nr:hypothetical protein [Deltaproteobacteria bacterium]